MLHFLKKYKKKILRVSLGLSAFFAICMFMVSHIFAADGDGNNNLISIGISSGEGSDMASVLQMLLVLTVLSLAPSILMMLTSFTRIVIVLHFTRAAIGTQTVPPNQVIVGLSLLWHLRLMKYIQVQLCRLLIMRLQHRKHLI